MRWIWLHGPSVAYPALIFFLSHQGRLPAPPTNDKVVHFVAYAVMGAVFARSLWFDTPWRARWVVLAAAAAATLYGISDEWHQSFVPGRDASVGDVAADAVGAVVGASVLGVMAARFTTRWPRATRPQCSVDARPGS